MADKKQILDALIDLMFAATPQEAVKAILKGAVELLDLEHEKRWEDLYVEAFKAAVGEMEPRLREEAERGGVVGLDEGALRAALQGDLSPHALAESELLGDRFLDTLADRLCELDALIIGGNRLSKEGYRQLTRNLVRQYAPAQFKQTIESDEGAFRQALRRQTLATDKRLRAVQDFLKEKFGIVVDLLVELLDTAKATQAVSEATHEEVKEARKDIEELRHQVDQVARQVADTAAPDAAGPAIPQPGAGEHYVERELDQAIHQALKQGEKVGVRGLRGMGGIGKTEMAIALARYFRDEGVFPGGVIWVNLSGREPARVFEQYERQLRLPPQGERDDEQRADAIRAALGARPALVVLDAAREEDARHMRDLYLPPDGCAVLVTTRLQSVPGVHRAQMKSLDVFDEGQALDLLTGIIAAADEGVPGREEAALKDVAKLCGYHALALDVSARRILTDVEDGRKKPVARQAERLRDMQGRLDALHLPEDELSVETSLRVSYDALSDTDQRCLDLLGVLASEVMHPAMMAAVWETDEGETERALRRFRHLSIAIADGDLWRMHDLWRSFAARRLRERLGGEEAEWRAVRTRHAVAATGLAVAWSDRNDAYRLAPFLPDLDAAYTHLLAIDAPDLLYRLVWHADDLLDMLGEWGQRGEWLARALEAITGEDEEARGRHARLQGSLADLAVKRGDWNAAEQLQRAALEVYEALGDRRNVAVGQSELADLAIQRGDWDAAEELHRAALATFEALGDRRDVVVSQGKLADLAARRGDWDAAEQPFRAALAVFEALGDRREIAAQRGKLADLAAQRGDWDAAEELHRAALATFEALGDRRSVAVSQGKLADLAIQRGDWDAAEELHRAALATFEALGDRRENAVSQAKIGGILVTTDRRDEGCTMLAESLETLRQLGAKREIAQVEELIARLCDGTPQRGLSDQELGTVLSYTAAALGDHPEIGGQLKADTEVAAEWAKAAGDADAEGFLRAVVRLLEGGVEALDAATPDVPQAYRDAWETLSAHLEGEGRQNIFNAIAERTIEALTTKLDIRGAWFDSVHQIQARANQAGDTQMIELTKAVSRLLLDGKPPEDDPPLEGEHKACWERIMEGLK